MKKTALLLSLAAFALPAPALASTNIVSNGSFESGTNPGGFTEAPTYATIDDWTIVGTVDYIGSYWTAEDGSRSVDLAGSTPGTISQLLTTVIGQTYNVSFWVSKNPDGGAPTRTGTVDFGGSSQVFSYSANNSEANMLWQLATYSFTATSTSTLLSFAADASAGCCYGPALDNVSVTATPEPAAWLMMILGFGLVGGAIRSRRKGFAFA